MMYFLKSNNNPKNSQKNSLWLLPLFMTALIMGGMGPLSSAYAGSQTIKPTKRFVVDYKDYNTILEGLILVKWANTRKPKLKAVPPTGTRISFVNKKKTRLESNQVMFHLLNDEHKEFIKFTRQSLEAIPAEFPLNKFGTDEQLAYWLNLRNITVLESVMDIYPIMKLKRPWSKIANNKRLTIAGIPMSINDIETLIINNWPNPQVIYGFYNGTVGGPNIRKRAFTGRLVWEELRRNAWEFTNSLKGVQFFKKKAKISEFYGNYPVLFPNLQNDVKEHMLTNLHPKLGDQLRNAQSVKFAVNDWSIADLMNGRLGLSSAGSIGPAALLFGIKGNSKVKTALIKVGMNELKYLGYPAHVQTYLRGMTHRMRESFGEFNSGNVTIDEVDSKTIDLPSKKDEKKKNNPLQFNSIF